MTRPRLCILGGTGFVGRQVTAVFARHGFDITVLTRAPARHRELLVLPSVRLVQADVHDPATLRAAFAGCEGVINLVGILNERGHRGRGFTRAHVTLAQNLLEACTAAGVTRLLHMSALNAGPQAPSHYLRSKGEAARRVLAAQGALGVTVFEPSVIFGAGDSFIARFTALLRVMPVFPLACPRARFAPVWVGDVAEAMWRSYARRDSFGQRHALCGPTVYTLRELVKLAARQAGLRRWIVGLPRWASWLQAASMEWLPGKPFSLDNYRSLKLDSVCNGKDGFAALGITPTPLDAVLPEYSGNLPR
ncbi:MAG TPA: complex I NDUFA9 subunit family protein [Gammaproteobacteria bacterium]|nr:complex I NDUFA9 subunit family protein [Gammaproteobacteria bacterium]